MSDELKGSSYISIERKAGYLDAVLKISIMISSSQDLNPILLSIGKIAVELMGVEYCSFMSFAPDLESGQVKVEYPDLDLLGLNIPLEDIPAKEKLLQSGQSVIIDNVSNDLSPGILREILLKLDIRSTLFVPVISKGRVLGSFNLHTVGRTHVFTVEEIDFCQIFAAQVALAIENAQLFKESCRHTEQMDVLRKTTLEITSQLDSQSLPGVIIKRAVELLHAKSGAIYSYCPEGDELEVIADYNRPNHVGKKLKGGEGIAGQIIRGGRDFIIVNSYNEWPNKSHIYEDNRIFAAVLQVPLKWQEQVIGVIYIDDQLGRKFEQEDVNLLSIFANQAAVALKGAELVRQLGAKKDYLARLLASSPNGVIAIDSHGIITEFSKQAQEVLNYKRSEIVGKTVSLIYVNPKEANRIGNMLGKKLDGNPATHETLVRSKTGEHIPIHLTATWLHNAQGDLIGSVGYFEDIRPLKEAERRLARLLKANSLITQAENQTSGLQILAELLVTILNNTFCRIFLLDDSQKFLIAKAAHRIPRSQKQLEWNPRLEEATAIADWPGLNKFLNESGSTIIRITGEKGKNLLTEWTDRLEMKQPIQSLLVIPLRTRERVIGLLDIGEVRNLKRVPFSSEKRDLAIAIADQIAVLIDHLVLHEITNRRKQLLAALDGKVLHLREDKEPSRLLKELVRLAAELVNCPVGGLYLNHPNLGELELTVTYGLPSDLIGNRLPHAEETIGFVARTGKSKIVYNYSGLPSYNGSLQQFPFQTMIAVPLKQAGKVEAVLFVADQSSGRQLMEIYLDVLERFAAHASTSWQTSKLMDPERRKFAPIAILHRISNYLQKTKDLDNILHAVLTGITAGYGLGFNRAALFLLDERQEFLIGQIGIGHIEEPDMRADWEVDDQEGLDFDEFVKRLEVGTLKRTPIDNRIRKLALSLLNLGILNQVLEERKHIVFTPDDIPTLPDDLKHAFEPALPCVAVPLVARNQAIGLILADNKVTHDPITKEHLSSLLTFADTVAVGIDNIRLFQQTQDEREKLKTLFEASKALISSQDPNQVLLDIVEQIRIAADASWVRLILISETRQALGEIIAGTDRPLQLDISSAIRPNGISMRVMDTGQAIAIEDTYKERERINPLLLEYKAGAALCLPLSLQEKAIGVVWIHYEKPRYFPNSEIDALQLYVHQAAIAYDNSRQLEEKARLLDQVSRAKKAGQVVAQVTALGDREATLSSVTQGTLDALGCDAVVLYVYDQAKNKLEYPPIHAGVWYPQAAWPNDQVPSTSIVYKMLQRNDPYIVTRTDEDPIFMGRRFALVEKIRSCVAIPLKAVRMQKVGVMFVNYRTQHSFTIADLGDLELFANQAAVAISNAQLFEEQAKKFYELEAFVTLSQQLLGAVSIQDTLDCAVAVASRLLEADYCDIVLPNNQGDLIIRAATGWKQEYVGYKLDSLSGSQTGYTIMTEAPVVVDDYSKESRFTVPSIVRENGIKSGISVPMLKGNKVVGAMLVHSTAERHFSKVDVNVLSLIANQTAIAIVNAQEYEAIKEAATSKKPDLSDEIRQAYEKLKEVDKKKMEFVSNISHGLRTPLTPINSLIQNLLQGIYGHLSDQQRGILESVLASIREETRLIGNLLDMAHIQEYGVRPKQVTTNLVKLIRNVLSAFEYEASQKKITLRAQHSLGEVLEVWMDDDKVKQVLVNLIDNGIKFTNEGGIITVAASKLEDSVEIQVTDTGCGIPKAEHEKIFERFYRGGDSLKANLKGTGVGLNIAKEYVEMHGGRIWVESVAGKGSTFLFTLPMRSSE